MTLTTVIQVAQGVPESQTRITAVNVPKGVNAMTDETSRSVDAVIGGAIGPYGESKLKGAHDEHWTPAHDTGRHRAAVKENIMHARFNFHPLARLILGLLVLSTGAYGATPLAASSLPVPHAPILITKDSDFVTCGCVVAGDGSSGNPFQIGPWKIDDLSSGFAVRIKNGKGG